MTYFPFPNGSVNSIIGLLQYDNIVTNNYFGYGILLMLFIVFFLSLKNFEAKNAFAGASFIIFILSGFFWIMGLIDYYTMWLPVVLMATSVAWLMMSEG